VQGLLPLDAIQCQDEGLADHDPGGDTLHRMRRRSFPDPLQPLTVPTWLVTRNAHRQALDSRELAAGADLRAILVQARDERLAAGWACTDIGPAVGFFFAERAGERLQVSIERYDPSGPGAPGHSDSANQ
jgi:hypothetical protein